MKGGGEIKGDRRGGRGMMRESESEGGKVRSGVGVSSGKK